MPELDFQITGVEAAARSVAPLLHFHLRVTNTPAEQMTHGVMLHAQIQIESARRSYTATEKEGLSDLFGTPDRWGQTLRNRLWAHADVSVPGFSGSTETILAVPCTYDLNVGTAKYFHALEGGEVPLLFLFSGSVFYATPEGALQVQRISWEKECSFRMPASLWQSMMEQHFANTSWLYLQKEVFERLYAYKRRRGLATWEQAIEQLLPEFEPAEVTR